MTHKKTVGIMLLLSVFGFVLGLLLSEQASFGLCREGYDYLKGEEGNLNNPPTIGCLDPLGESVGQPLGMGSVVLIIVFLLLFFLPHTYFTSWLKYAAWFIPVAIVWIVTSDVSCGGGLGFGMCFDKELATWWSSGIFLVLSLGVIAVAHLTRRK